MEKKQNIRFFLAHGERHVLLRSVVFAHTKNANNLYDPY